MRPKVGSSDLILNAVFPSKFCYFDDQMFNISYGIFVVLMTAPFLVVNWDAVSSSAVSICKSSSKLFSSIDEKKIITL